MAEFLGEIVGTPFPDEDSIPLRAARKDAPAHGRPDATVDFLGATCAAQPLLLVLEDLHWGDLPTVQFIGAALRGWPWRRCRGAARPGTPRCGRRGSWRGGSGSTGFSPSSPAISTTRGIEEEATGPLADAGAGTDAGADP